MLAIHLKTMPHTYTIFSNQESIHKNLIHVCLKHIHSQYKRPLSKQQADSFEQMSALVKKQSRPLILDSGCGNANSSILLAQKYPEHLVIGIDKSIHRLKTASNREIIPQNCATFQIDYFDAWMQMSQANWKIDKHFIFYPNPWPKAEHLKRRIYAHPVFSSMLNLSPYLEIRSNWYTYLLEAALSIEVRMDRKLQIQRIGDEEPISAFENKYKKAKCPIFRLIMQEKT